MCRHDGHRVSQATVLRLLRDEGLLLEVTYQRERRQLAARRKAAFATEPTGPNQVWQLDFSPVRDHRRRHVAAGRLPGLLVKVRAGLACGTDGQLPRRQRRGRAGAHRGGRLTGRPLLDLAERKTEGNVLPLVTIVTDNGGPFRSFQFEAGGTSRLRGIIATHPELRHVRTRVKTPGSERLTRARLRLAEAREAVPRGDARRPGPRHPRRGLPGRVQHRPPSRGAGLEPPPRGPPRLGRPVDPQPSPRPDLPAA
jgi:hypothetical protein